MWFKSKEQKEKEASEKKAAYIAERVTEGTTLDSKLSRYKKKYCMDSKGVLYGFSHVRYNEKNDSIEGIITHPDSTDGTYYCINWDISGRVRRDRERWEDFKDNLTKMGLEVKKIQK